METTDGNTVGGDIGTKAMEVADTGASELPSSDTATPSTIPTTTPKKAKKKYKRKSHRYLLGEKKASGHFVQHCFPCYQFYDGSRVPIVKNCPYATCLDTATKHDFSCSCSYHVKALTKRAKELRKKPRKPRAKKTSVVGSPAPDPDPMPSAPSSVDDIPRATPAELAYVPPQTTPESSTEPPLPSVPIARTSLRPSASTSFEAESVSHGDANVDMADDFVYGGGGVEHNSESDESDFSDDHWYRKVVWGEGFHFLTTISFGDERGWVVPGFNTATKSLDFSCFFHLYGQSTQFADGDQFLIGCECCERGKFLVGALGKRSTDSMQLFEDAISSYGTPCIHEILIRSLLPVLLEEPEEYVSPIIALRGKFPVKGFFASVVPEGNDQTRAVVRLQRTWSCLGCRRSKCPHTQAIALALTESNAEDEDDEDEEVVAPAKRTHCLGPSLRLEVDRLTLAQKLAQTSRALSGIFSLRGLKVPSASCVCERSPCACNSKCACGAEWSGNLTADHQVTIYDTRVAIRVHTGGRRCSNPQCAKTRVWDGMDSAVVRLTPQIAITYELARHILSEIVNGKVETVNIWSTIQDDYRGTCGDLQTPSDVIIKFLNAKTFQEVVWTLLDSLDIDYVAAYTCSTCGDFATAPYLVSDGTTVSFRAALNIQPRRLRTAQSRLRRGTMFHDRVLIRDAGVRQSLREFAKSQTPPALLISECLPSILAICVRKATDVVPMLGEMQSCSTPAFAILRSFLSEIAKATPVAGGLTKWSEGTPQFLQDLASGRPLSTLDWISLAKCFPLMHQTLRSLGCTGVPSYFSAILLSIAQKCDPCNGLAHEEFKDDSVWSSVSADEDLCSGFWYPGTTEERTLHQYAKRTRGSEASSTEHCRKDSQRHPFLLPGIFLVFCPHGVCLGWHVMTTCESPETAFTLLYTRRRIAPDVFIYDNCCKLQDYALNREPYFFRKMRCFIDRLHRCGHVGCGCAFDLDRFPEFTELNSQVAEQFNVFAKSVQSQVSYMSQLHFSLFLRFFFARMNDKKKAALETRCEKEVAYRERVERLNAKITHVKEGREL